MSLLKPETCRNCPFEKAGLYFTPDRMVPGARVTVLAQNPGANEERGQRITSYTAGQPITTPCEPQPLVGATGYVLKHTYLPLAGLTREGVSYANVIKCRVGGKNTLPTGADYEKAVEHCTKAHLRIPDGGVVVAMGAHALAYVAPGLGITEWRGYLVPEGWGGRSVYAVGHLADTFRDPVEKLNARSDWRRLGEYLAGRWPVREPVWGLDWKVTPSDYPSGVLPVKRGDTVYLDTEYRPNKKKPWLSQLQLIGLRMNGQTIQYNWPALSRHEREEVRQALEQIAADCIVVIYNAAADLPILEHTLDIPRESWRHLKDPMLLHHELWSELKHGMQYTASLYGVLAQPKEYRKSLDFYRYNMGDLMDMEAIWLALETEALEHPKVCDFYHTYVIPAIHEVTRAQERGLRVHQEAVSKAKIAYEASIHETECIAAAYVGRPFNLGSNPQMIEALPATMTLRKGKHTKAFSMGADAIASYRAKVTPAPDTDQEADNGLSPEDALARIADGAQPLLEARVAYASINARLTHFINALEGQERVYPQCKQYAQDWHRWSWVEPPMQNVPPDLEGLFGPDEGWVWFGWDWRGQEDWLHAAESNDTRTLEALRRGDDLHTLKARDMFPGLNGHVDKKDPRRLFAKRYRHRFKFGATIAGLKTMPGVAELGLDTQTLMQMMARDAAANPSYSAWRARVAERVSGRRYDIYQDIPTWSGRFRRTFERDGKLVRVAYNASQGGGADQLNRTVVGIANAFHRDTLQLAYTAHDSGVLHVKAEAFTKETCAQIVNIVEAPFQAWGHTLDIKADWWVQHTLGGLRERWVQ